MNKIKNYAVILASGTGSRFGANLPKQFIKINGKTILEYSVEAFDKNENIDNIIVVIAPKYRNKAKKIIEQNKYKKVSSIINGGEIRKISSYNGISIIKDKEANVLIHDCARPFVSEKIINNCISELKKYDAVGVAIPTTDTIIETENNMIKSIPLRDTLMRIQTPQCFKLSLIKKAHELSKDDSNFTDDCGLIIKYNLAEIRIVNGDNNNIKITFPEDIITAKHIVKNLSL